MDSIPRVVASESGAAQTLPCVVSMKVGLRVDRSIGIKERPLRAGGDDCSVRSALKPSNVKFLAEQFWKS
jgi:hypothetical protein